MNLEKMNLAAEVLKRDPQLYNTLRHKLLFVKVDLPPSNPITNQNPILSEVNNSNMDSKSSIIAENLPPQVTERQNPSSSSEGGQNGLLLTASSEPLKHTSPLKRAISQISDSLYDPDVDLADEPPHSKAKTEKPVIPSSVAWSDNHIRNELDILRETDDIKADGSDSEMRVQFDALHRFSVAEGKGICDVEARGSRSKSKERSEMNHSSWSRYNESRSGQGELRQKLLDMERERERERENERERGRETERDRVREKDRYRGLVSERDRDRERERKNEINSELRNEKDRQREQWKRGLFHFTKEDYEREVQEERSGLLRVLEETVLRPRSSDVLLSSGLPGALRDPYYSHQAQEFEVYCREKGVDYRAISRIPGLIRANAETNRTPEGFQYHEMLSFYTWL